MEKTVKFQHLLQSNETVKPMAHRSPVFALRGLRILLADDSVDNQVLFSRMLKGAGAQVDVAENGRVAVELALETVTPYDAVVMDIRMPVMDGYEATRRIRHLVYCGPIIALTAHAVPGEEARCRQAGCSHFLTKPIDRQRIVETVRLAVLAKTIAESSD